MCEQCRQNLLVFYKNDNRIWQRAQEMAEESPWLSSIAHCVFEDDNLEYYHLCSAHSEVTAEIWQRDQVRRVGKRVDFLEEVTDAQLEDAQDKLSELMELAKVALDIPSDRE